MTKIVINKGIGGFGLSNSAVKLYAEKKGITLYPGKKIGTLEFGACYSPYQGPMPDALCLVEDEIRWFTEPIPEDGFAKDDVAFIPYFEIARDDPALVAVVEELGEKAGEPSGELAVVEIPDDVKWEVHESDTGAEWIAEVHRTWRS